jgi:putative salt-induced outer membrane protein YdiY
MKSEESLLNIIVIKLFYICLTLAIFTAKGQENEELPTNWHPPVPAFTQDFDWLKLKSGEWLKGDIISMYDDELEFESDEFGIIIFDWQDVIELRSRFDQQIRFDNGEVKQGFLVVKEGHLVLISDGTEQHYPLSELLSITASADNRKQLWDGKITLGIDGNSGNVNQLDYMANVSLQRRTPYSRFKVDFIYNFSESTADEESKVIADSSRLSTYFDWFYSSQIFFRLFDYEHFSDFQQNIDARDTLGFSFGYHIIQNKRLQWDITLGPSYQKTSYIKNSLESDQSSAVVAFSSLFDYSFSSRVDYILDYQLQFVEEESGKRNTHLKTGFEFEFKNDLDLDVMFYLDRVAEPVSAINLLPPEPNDYGLVFSLGYKF